MFGIYLLPWLSSSFRRISFTSSCQSRYSSVSSQSSFSSEFSLKINDTASIAEGTIKLGSIGFLLTHSIAFSGMPGRGLPKSANTI